MRASLASAPLFWRVFLMNAIVFALGTAVLALTPVTVSFPLALTEAVVLVVGLAAMLVANAFLVRLTLTPLEQLASLMERIDLLRPGQRLRADGPREATDVIDAFNEMLERLETERRLSSGRVHAEQEAERRRLAQELHDEIGQSLTALLLGLRRCIDVSSGEARSTLLEMQATTRASLDELRRIVRQLRPEALDELGLVSALNALGTAFSRHTGLRLERRFSNHLPPLTADAELALYRVAQESLTNVARHSAAARVRMSLDGDRDRVVLRVVDDGIGLDGPVDAHGGIRGMRERAMLVGGDLSVTSFRGGGTEIRLSVPAAPERVRA